MPRKYEVGNTVTYRNSKYRITQVMKFTNSEGILEDRYYVEALHNDTLVRYASVPESALSITYTDREMVELLLRAQKTYGYQNQDSHKVTPSMLENLCVK